MTIGNRSDDKKGIKPPGRLFQVIAVIALVAFAAVSAYLAVGAPACSLSMFPTCKRNCANLGTFCEMYSSDNDLYYPQNLEILVEKGYVKELPRCYASSGRNLLDRIYYRFSGRYFSEPQMTYVLKSFGKDGVIIYCSGNYHSKITGIKEGPAYGSRSGAVDTLDLATY